LSSSARSIAAALVALGVMAPALSAHAGGLYLGDRGVRPLGRGGAFVAGADDPSALWYNPAGMAFSGRQLLVDTTLTFFDGSFARIDGGGAQQPEVSGHGFPLPIPTLAYTDNFGLDDFTFGAAIFAPNAVLPKYTETITVDGVEEPAPQRYSLISLDGTVLLHATLGVAWRPIPQLSIGAAFELVMGSFRTQTTLSACDRAICTQPENPEWDTPSEVELGPFFSPTAVAGVTFTEGIFRAGASLMLPYDVSGEATLRVRVPTAAYFDGAYVEGDKAALTLAFPLILRLGAEVRPVEGLRVEGSFVLEGWSRQQEIGLVPEGVFLRNVTAIGDYEIGPVSVQRHMKDVLSFRLGGEYSLGPRRALTLRAGALFETGAFEDSSLTVLTLDSDKLVASIGASYEVTPGFSIDAVYAHSFIANRQVRNSTVPQSNPIRPEPADPVYVGNGDYALEANTIGVGIRWQPGAHAPAAPPSPAPASEPAPEPATTPTPAPVDTPVPPPAQTEPIDPSTPWYLRH